jgi:hypothetical protein
MEFQRFNVTGLVVTGVSLVMVLNSFGWLGKPWIKEDVDKLPPLVCMVLGLLVIAGSYFGHRAETTSSERARRQFRVVQIVAGTVMAGMFFGCAALVSLFVTSLGALLVVPWFHQSSFDELLTWSEKGPTSFIIAGILLVLIILGAAGESVYRRHSLNDHQSSDVADMVPLATVTIVLALAMIGFGAMTLSLGLGLMLSVLAERATSFSDGMGWLVEWLERNRNIKWMLPVSCTVLAAMVALHLYRRARWAGPDWNAPTFFGSTVRVALVCCGMIYVSVVTLFILHKGS